MKKSLFLFLLFLLVLTGGCGQKEEASKIEAVKPALLYPTTEPMTTEPTELPPGGQ